MGRANAGGKPIFYASAGGPTTFVESKCLLGSRVLVSEFRGYKDFFVQKIGFADEHHLLSDYELLMKVLFTYPGNDFYAYSSKVAEHLLGKNPNPIHGLLYPSIASQNFSQNLTIKPSYVDSFLHFINVTAYRVNSISNKFNYDVTEIDFGVRDGDLILWKGRRKNWRNAVELSMVSSGWNWDAFDNNGNLIDPE